MRSKSQRHDGEQGMGIQQRQQPEPVAPGENNSSPLSQARFAEISGDLLDFLLNVKHYLDHKEHVGYIY